MARDYAKQGTRNTKTQKNRRGLSVLFVSFALIFISSLVIVFYIHNSAVTNHTGIAQFLSQLKKRFHRNVPEHVIAVKQIVTTKKADEVRFDFYDALPTMHVTSNEQKPGHL